MRAAPFYFTPLYAPSLLVREGPNGDSGNWRGDNGAARKGEKRVLRQQAIDVEFGLGADVNLAVGDRRGGEFDGEAGGVAPAGSLAAVV